MREGRGVSKKEERDREREYGGVKKGGEKGRYIITGKRF
jgi:hypothetical protein